MTTTSKVLVVAPLVGRILEMILPYLKIERQDESQIEKELRLWIDPIYVKTPLFIGMNRNKIKHNSSKNKSDDLGQFI